MNDRHIQFRSDPDQFQAVTGLMPEEFDVILAEVEPRLRESEQNRLTRAGRRRAIGGGHPFGLGLADQILLALIRTRHAATLAALGDVFGVSIWTVIRVVRRVGPFLTLDGANPLRPVRGRPDRDDSLRRLAYTKRPNGSLD